ncbi:MAG: ATP-dependent zinc metalloprotease FtsH [Chlorobi bacterium]|nr:ATP-dependent zinc metalloprotease FtsH [Chlorobiota bacterium]
MSEEKKGNTKQNNSGEQRNPFTNLPGKSDSNKPKFNFYWIYGMLAVLFIIATFINWGTTPKNVDWGSLKEMLQSGDVDKIVVVNKEFAEIYIKPDRLNKEKYKDASKNKGVGSAGPQYIYTVGSVDGFKEDVNEAQKDVSNPIYITYENRHNWGADVLSWVLPIGLLLVVWFFFMRMMSRGGGGAGGQIFNIGKSKAQIYDKKTNINISFKDVAGLEEAKVEIKEIVDFLKNPEKYTRLGGKIPRGVLLVGPPGTGKTLLAKSVAGEAHVPFYSISGSDFVEMFVGVGASRVRDLFKQAKEKAPSIIFIDEIDAIGRARGRNPVTGANDERENTLNQLLTEMDGFTPNSGVIVLAATNRADILDKALLRAGRFDRQIHVELPSLEERKAIFKVHMRPLKLGKDVNIEFLARQTPGFSGADIANVCNESALIAARAGHSVITKEDFMSAIDRIIGGLEKKNKVIAPNEKETVAFHEAGHATISWLLEHANPLVKVTIVPRGKSLGAAWYLPEERQLTTKEQMLDEMTAALGGRAAEELVFKKVSTGALNDLERVTKQAFAMVAYYGFSKRIGNISFYDSTGQQDYAFNKPFSEKTNEIIDEEVKNMVEESYVRAKKLLTENLEGLTKLAKKLLEKEVIFSDDLEKVFGKRKWGDTAVYSVSPDADKKTDKEPAKTIRKTTSKKKISSNNDPDKKKKIPATGHEEEDKESKEAG